ncbi:MAG: hypothetical protein NXI21_04970 [Alphaproteobacteria bacterium]|nr:hypothetical protein [Alphaproteobacteria bacterium]
MSAATSRLSPLPWARLVTRLACLVLAVVALAACETRVETPRYADITFAHQAQIALDVAEIEVVRVYRPTAQPPNVEVEFPVSPLDTAARWAVDRLRAVGSSGRATVRILDASVVERPLDKTEGVTGLFTTDQAERYEARFFVELSAEDANRGIAAQTTAEVSRSRTAPEGLTLNEREALWYEMTEKLAGDLDRQMSANIRAHMGAFLAP